MKTSLSICMHSKVILPMLLVIFVIGVTQFAFAEESETKTYIAVYKEEIDRPKSTYDPEEITITGYIKDYLRGGAVKIIIISPDKSEENVNTYASKRGDIFTLFQITKDSQFGIHQVILKYNGAEIASTSFEILDNRSDFERWKDNYLK